MGLCGASAARPRRTAWGVATLVELSAATTAGTARGPRWRHGALLHVRAAPARGHRETQAGAAAEGVIAAGGTAPGARPAPCTITTRNRAGGCVGSPSLPRATETSGGEALTTHRLVISADDVARLRVRTRTGLRSTPRGPDTGWRRRRRRCRCQCRCPHVRPLDQSPAAARSSVRWIAAAYSRSRNGTASRSNPATTSDGCAASVPSRARGRRAAAGGLVREGTWRGCVAQPLITFPKTRPGSGGRGPAHPGHHPRRRPGPPGPHGDAPRRRGDGAVFVLVFRWQPRSAESRSGAPRGPTSARSGRPPSLHSLPGMSSGSCTASAGGPARGCRAGPSARTGGGSHLTHLR